MEAKFQIFLILLAVLAGTALLARRINVAPAILLLRAGIALAFVPGMPAVELPPAVAAISAGLFSIPKATGTFAVIVVGEILFGVAIGWLSLRARHRARDPQVEITLSLITPYLAFWIPEHLGGSGVIATVACGLYI